MNPLAYLRVAEIVAGLALVFGICWGVHEFLEHERGIGRAEIQQQWDKQRLVDKLAAEKQEADWRAKYDSAVKTGAENAQILQHQLDTVRAASDSLRSTNSTLQQFLPTATAEAARKYAAAYGNVFNECVERYKAMGEAAQGHANDSRSLSEAWPQGKVSPTK